MTFKFLNKISSGSLPRTTPTEIICGDCAGDALLPIRTNLTTTGACAVCGGRSFVMASPLARDLAQHLKTIRQENFEIWTPIITTKQEKF